MKLATLSGGSGILEYRGLTIESKDGIEIKPSLDTFNVAIDGISEEADKRTTANQMTINVTPTGKWTNPDRLFPYLGMPAGRFVLPVLPVSINISTEVFTATKHGLITGDRVQVGIRAGGTLPTSSPQVDEDTFYFINRAGADTFTLHASRANALAGTSAVNFSAAGTDVVIVGQFDLVLRMEDGEVFTFHAAALTGHPDLNLTRSETPFGGIEFRAMLRNGKHADDADSIYTRSTDTFPGWSANASDIKTQSPKVAWADLLSFVSGAVNTTTNQITLTAHGLATEAKVYLDSIGSLPGATPALNPETPYFIRAVDADTITLHLSAAAATAGTGAIDFTSGGSGTHLVFIDNPPWTLLDTEAGVKVSSSVSLEDRAIDRDGVVNAQLKTVGMEATLIPLGPTGNQVLNALKLQGSGATLGRSLSASGKALHLFSSGMYVRLNGAALVEGPLRAKMSEGRVGELKFTATRVVTAGTVADVGVVSTAP